MNNNHIKTILEKYITLFPEEKNNFPVIEEQLKNKELIIRRSTLFGHATASGVILKDGKIFLIFHNKLKKYIQPGGHIEDDISLWKAAEREVFEETGIKTVLHPWHHLHDYIPINIDTHTIPFNLKKQEQEHFHHDATFIFRVADESIQLQKEEVSDYKWLWLEDNFDERLLDNVVKKIIKLGIV